KNIKIFGKLKKKKIVESFKKITNLEFKEDVINAVVFFGISQSHPLSLRANLTVEFKKANLVHELGHRLVSGAGVRIWDVDPLKRSLETHKLLDLFLYDVLVDLYGEEYAIANVELETGEKRPTFYKEAWDWALSFTREERAEKFKELLASFHATI